MQLPLAYLDASVVEEVPVGLWREVFNAVGWPTTLAAKRDSFTHADVLDAFERDDPTDGLLQAIEALHDLGTESGRDAIMSAMNDRRIPTATLPASASARDLAIHLFLAQRSDASLADIFARAQTQLQERADHRRYYEYLGKELRAVSNLEAKRNVLHEAVVRYCHEKDLGDHVHVRAFEDDGAYVFQIIRSHHTKKPLAVVAGRSARATIEYRPVHGDILRYDSAVGRLRIVARAASVVEFYRRELGRVLFDDDMFFAGEAVCTLKVLQERGRAALENHGVPGIGRVWMTECLWERGDRDLLQLRSRDCFRNIEELRLPLTEGDLIQAKLKIEVADKSARAVTVNIRAPSRIEVTQKRHEKIIDRFLTTVGIINAKRRSSDVDLWSLHPWRHPVSVWRTLFGKATDALVQEGVLVPIQLSSIPSADHIGGGRVLEAHPVSGGEFYGVSRVPEIPSRSLSSTDIDGLALDPEQLRIHLRARLGISSVAVPWDGLELLDLGNLEVGGQHLRIVYALRQPPPGIGDRIRAWAGGAHPVLLIPSLRYDGSELAKVVIGEPLFSRDQVIRQAVAACSLTTAVPALFSAPEGARLVVDAQRGQVWLDGVEISGLRTGTHPFRLVEVLARKSPLAVSTEELSSELSGARRDGDTPARQAKTAARKCISDAMAKANITFDDDPFPSGPTGCYRCVLPSYVA